MSEHPPVTFTDEHGNVRPWQSLADVEFLVAKLQEAIGPGAVVIVMVGKNDHPHSRHHVSWSRDASCLEIRGLLAQCTDIIERRFDGNNPYPTVEVPVTVGGVGGNGAGQTDGAHGYIIGGGGGGSETSWCPRTAIGGGGSGGR